MQFIKGMRDKLQKHLDDRSVFEVKLLVDGPSVYDCCCFGVDAKGTLSNEDFMIFYNQTESPNKEISYLQEGNETRFTIDLKRMPSEIVKLVFTASIDGSDMMSNVKKLRFLVSQNGKEAISIENTGSDFLREKAVIVAEIYKKDCWRIAAISNGFNGGLSALLKYFGGVEEKQEVVRQEQTSVQQSQESSRQGKELSRQRQEPVRLRQESARQRQEPVRQRQELVRQGQDSVRQRQESARQNQEPMRQRHESARQIKVTVPQKKEVSIPSSINRSSTIVGLKYNPYTVDSVITIDGQEVQPPNKLYDLKNERIQVWIDRLLPILTELCNDTSFEIRFYGLQMDYNDICETIEAYCKEHQEIKVTLRFTEARSSDDRLLELKKLFDVMQRECPFEDLKTKQIKDNFYNAISTEFEVSVIATMSSGKSTLINAILGQELMPSKNEACTATIARIKDDNQGRFFSAEYRDKENHVLGNFDHVSLADMEMMNADSNTAFIDIEGNIPNIDSSGIKLVLVDTPGPNNSRTEEHKNHTYRVIKEKSKPMVLYVLNATQLQTNDDYALLSAVAEAMKVGGKQSKDRFLFAVNKIDQFDPDKESVQDALCHVREYLKKFDIENPNLFPTSAETAKVIRMHQGGAQLTKGQTKTWDNCQVFVEEPQLHLSGQASLSRNNLARVHDAIESAKRKGDLYEEVMWHTGVPAVEMAINEYLKKYAYTTKIKTAVDTFKKKVEEKDMHAKMLSSIQNNEALRNEIHEELETIKNILEEGQEAQKFRSRIEALDMMKEAKLKIRKIRAKITKELNPSSGRGAMETLEVQQLMMKLNVTVMHLQSDVKTELEEIIKDVIVENANNIMKEYSEHIHSLIQNGVVRDQQYLSSDHVTGIDFLEMDIPNAQEIINSYKYDERYEAGEEWVENTRKKWYKPWTWFEESGHYRTIYANREMVDYSTVENEYLSPIIQSFNENLESAQNAAQEEAEQFKQFFLKQLDELQAALKKKVEENERLTQNQENVNRIIESEKEKAAWLEGFLKKLDAILEI